MGKFEWAETSIEQDLGGPVDARRGVILSRRRFVSLALYTSAAVVLSATRAAPVAGGAPGGALGHRPRGLHASRAVGGEATGANPVRHARSPASDLSQLAERLRKTGHVPLGCSPT